MNQSHTPASLDRRMFLKATVAAGGGLMIGASLPVSSRIQVPSASVNVERTCRGTPWLRANSTARS